MSETLRPVISGEAAAQLQEMADSVPLPPSYALNVIIKQAYERHQALGSFLAVPAAAPVANTATGASPNTRTRSSSQLTPEPETPRRYWEPLSTNPDGSKKHASTYKSEYAKARQAESKYRSSLVWIPDQLRHQFRYDPASGSLIAGPGLEDWLTLNARHPRTRGGYDFEQGQWLSDNGYSFLRDMPLPEYVERFRTQNTSVDAWQEIVGTMLWDPSDPPPTIADIPAEGWPVATWTPIWNVDRSLALRREGEAWPAGDPRLEGVRVWDDDEMERVRRGEPVA